MKGALGVALLVVSGALILRALLRRRETGSLRPAPQKLEVRFREPGLVHDFIFRTLERALGETRPAQPAAADIPAARFDQRLPLPPQPARRQRGCR